MGDGAGVIALYDMEHRISTYDYFTWLVHVKMLGATEIVFKTEPMGRRKWPEAEARKRFENYIKPGPALLDLPSRIGRDGNGKIGSYQLYDLAADLERLRCELPRLRSVLPPADVKYTVTIRETFHNPHKNSDRDLWLRFGERIGARIIEDHARAPIGLYERISLYAGAKMNFGVPNGPMGMLYFSDYPFRIFCDPVTSKKSFGGHRIEIGDQVPWLRPNQRLVWEQATMDGLMREFDAQA
jgi:hypothetical protein